MASHEDVRRIALSLPETSERDHRRDPAFWVGGRIFAMLDRRGPFTELKLNRDDQLNMIAAYPGIVDPAPDYPQHGWTYVWFEKADDALLETLLRLAWVNVAPKRIPRA
ncbi:MAG: MmcQ/YjbR family DNA-binding protein [Caulobacteraceae bacterium]